MEKKKGGQTKDKNRNKQTKQSFRKSKNKT